jgi:hypothetical protein
MTVELSDNLKGFVGEVFPAIIGTCRRDGSVQMNALWFEYRDGYFWLNGGPDRIWLKRVQRTNTVDLLLIDPKDMFRWAQVHGRLVSVTGGEEAEAHINRLSQRYLGRPYRHMRDPDPRLRIQVEPLRVRSSVDGWR